MAEVNEWGEGLNGVNGKDDGSVGLEDTLFIKS